MVTVTFLILALFSLAGTLKHLGRVFTYVHYRSNRDFIKSIIFFVLTMIFIMCAMYISVE